MKTRREILTSALAIAGVSTASVTTVDAIVIPPPTPLEIMRAVLEHFRFPIAREHLTSDEDTVLHGENPNVAFCVWPSGTVVVVHKIGDIRHYHECSVYDLDDLRQTVGIVLLQELNPQALAA